MERMSRKWQNLIHKKCPDCDARMQSTPRGFLCPATDHQFFITRATLGQYLTDPSHPIVRFASQHEREIINEALRELGIQQVDEFWRAPALKK